MKVIDVLAVFAFGAIVLALPAMCEKMKKQRMKQRHTVGAVELFALLCLHTLRLRHGAADVGKLVGDGSLKGRGGHRQSTTVAKNPQNLTESKLGSSFYHATAALIQGLGLYDGWIRAGREKIRRWGSDGDRKEGSKGIVMLFGPGCAARQELIVTPHNIQRKRPPIALT